MTLGALSACVQVPELDASLSGEVQNAAYPALVPIDRALGTLPAPAGEAERLQQSLEGRRDSLQTRARALQTPVIDERNRQRMAEGVSR